MDLIYKTVESLVKPLEVDTTINTTLVYIRKDINAVTYTDSEGNEKTKYVYQEAYLTPEEYKLTDLYQSQAQAMKNITKRQLLIWLYTNKSKTEDDISTAIETITDTTQKYLAKVNYNGTNIFYYGNTFVSVIGTALGLTTDEIKKMFDEAESL